MAQGWLAWQEFQSGTLIETAVCEGERRLGRHNLPVDGYCHKTRTVYEFKPAVPKHPKTLVARPHPNVWQELRLKETTCSISDTML